VESDGSSIEKRKSLRLLGDSVKIEIIQGAAAALKEKGSAGS
jgi:hypothetical protein